jgi:four helix bundle protein
MSVEAAMQIFELSENFPKEETYSLIDQIRRSSRSVAANIAEAWRKRRYRGSFLSTLTNAEGEAAETQTWLEFSAKCGYLDKNVSEELHRTYDHIIGKLVNMVNRPGVWLLSKSRYERDERSDSVIVR